MNSCSEKGGAEKGGVVPSFSHAVLSEHEIERISGLSAQEQAETLMQRAVNRYAGATELIDERVGSWAGQIGFSDQLYSLTNAGYESPDLRVRISPDLPLVG